MFQYHSKYRFKSRSDNEPHIYAVADSAVQRMLHHTEPQHIIFSGESFSGKTTSYNHLIDHLCYLGTGPQNQCGDLVKKALNVIQAFTHASTPVNYNSTRGVLQTHLTYATTGKISGAIFSLYLLEKLRISSPDKTQGNFHILYYFYHSIAAKNLLEKYHLEHQSYRYLRKVEGSQNPCNNPKSNEIEFLTIQDNLSDFGFEEDQLETIWRILAAIILLGDIDFVEDGGKANFKSADQAVNVAELLMVDVKKFCWTFQNYCCVFDGMAKLKKNTCDEAREARDILANNLYARLVDWILNMINKKFFFGRAL